MYILDEQHFSFVKIKLFKLTPALQAKMKRSMGGVDNGDLAEIEKRVNLKVVFWILNP